MEDIFTKLLGIVLIHYLDKNYSKGSVFLQNCILKALFVLLLMQLMKEFISLINCYPVIVVCMNYCICLA